MGLFFEKRESTNPFKMFHNLMLVLIGLSLILSIVNGFHMQFLKICFIISGIDSIIYGIEDLYKKEIKRVLSDLGIGLLWFIVFFSM